MITTRPSLIVAIARYHMRPARRALFRLRHREARRTWGVQLGPIEINGHEVILRSPRLSDAQAWRAARLAERDRMAQWWATAEDDWEARHNDRAWVAMLLQMRARARAGLALPLFLDVDGNFAGQCSLEWIAPHTATAELSVWLDTRWSRSGVSGVGAGMVVDYATTELGLRRLIAPIAVGNTAAMWGARRIGMRCEGTMESYLDVGGMRRDHQLWALTAERVPPGGLTPVLLDAARRGAEARAARRSTPRSAAT